MPNGISCVYFAATNYLKGKQNSDIFREGICGVQTVRTVDNIAQAANAASPIAGVTGKIAGAAKKLVYPLIILSGAYTTAKSKDKVRTGAEQAGGISFMYTFEKLAEKGLNAAAKSFGNSSRIPHNKITSTAFYIAKGAAFIGASLSGYSLGKSAGRGIVDKIRGNNTAGYTLETNHRSSVYDDFADFMPADKTPTEGLQES